MNLIICTSPLQMLIARKIIKLYKPNRFDLLLLSPIKNEKYEYYFNLLRKECNRSFWMLNYPMGARSFFKFILLIGKLNIIIKNRYDKIFLASIDDATSQYILSKTSFNNIFTFDDGSINLVNNNFSSINKSRFYIFFKVLFGLKYTIDKIKEVSKKHFTIYYGYRNILDDSKLEFLSLYTSNKEDNKNFHKKEVLNVLLGQKIFDNEVRNNEFILSVIDSFNIQFYYPHPKEKPFLDKEKLLESNLIFEDFLMNIIPYYKKVNVYTFFSSAAMNICSYDNVNVIAIKPDFIMNSQYLECYDILEGLGAKIVHFPSL